MIVNELQELNQPVWLVLDDYQFIRNTAIHDGMLFLIEHLPQHMHVMIATRSDPPLALSRLRACNALCEIRAEDLRFSLDETAAFLKTASVSSYPMTRSGHWDTEPKAGSPDCSLPVSHYRDGQIPPTLSKHFRAATALLWTI
jgi:hypothetical protein